MDKRSLLTYASWRGNTFKGSFSQNNGYANVLAFWLVLKFKKKKPSLVGFIIHLFIHLL